MKKRSFAVRLLGWLAILPYTFVAVLVVAGPATWSSLLYVLGIGAIVVGLSMRRRRGVTRAGIAAVSLVAFARCLTASDGEAMHLAGPGGAARIVDRLVDESDVAVAGTTVLFASGFLRDDAAALPSAMRDAYAEMRAAEGDAPSPLLSTYLGMQRPSGFDVLVVDPPAATRPDAAVIFLHGFAGGFDLPCWAMARAVAPLGLSTVCPSMGPSGAFWTPEGRSIVERTIAAMRSRGVTRIVLAGLSNGGLGASRLAPRLRRDLAGLIVVSGAATDAAAAGIPTLVIHGRHDTMASYAAARAYAARSSGRLVTLEAGHFAMLVRRSELDRAVRSFVERTIDTRRSPSLVSR